MDFSHVFPIFMILAGITGILGALTKPYLISEDGPPTKAEMEKFKATPRRRRVAIAIGLVFIVVGVILLLRVLIGNSGSWRGS